MSAFRNDAMLIARRWAKARQKRRHRERRALDHLEYLAYRAKAWCPDDLSEALLDTLAEVKRDMGR